MKSRRIIFFSTLIGIIILVLLAACSGAAPTQTPEANRTPTRTSLPTRAPTTTRTPELPAVTELEEEGAEARPTPLLGELISERTPEPTATPGVLAQAVENYAVRAGLATKRFLGISLPDWISLIFSALMILAGYILGTWLIRGLLPRLVKRTSSSFDDKLLSAIGHDIRWLVTLLILNIATTDRLTFVGAGLNQFLKDLYYVLTLSLSTWIIWKTIDLTAEWYTTAKVKEGREELVPIIRMLTPVVRIIIGMVGLTILLSYFGVNVTALTAALGIGGLAISLAAKDTVSDAIAGMIILIDRPFRVGDRIEIQSVGTWGDVTDIGLRTTRIRTRDNRMVIVPNSIISNNQVINYSYPDPRYRIETHVDIAFGSDVEATRRLLIDTVRQVEGVLGDKPVDALYIDMSSAAMKFRVRWWIESYVDTRRMFDRVHTAIQNALDEAGIESPNIADNVNLLVDQNTTERISQAFRSQPSDDGNSDDDVFARNTSKKI